MSVTRWMPSEPLDVNLAVGIRGIGGAFRVLQIDDDTGTVHLFGGTMARRKHRAVPTEKIRPLTAAQYQDSWIRREGK